MDITNENADTSLRKLLNSAELIELNRKENWPDLEPWKKAFAMYYVETYDHREAMERLGKNPDSGKRTLREPLVAALVGDLQAEYQQRSIVNADFIRMQWLKLLPKVMGEEDVDIVTPKGEQMSARRFDSNGAAKVLTELGKSTKFYEDGSGNGSVAVNINLGALGIEDNTKATIDITPEDGNNG